jgi:hypothetical protein
MGYHEAGIDDTAVGSLALNPLPSRLGIARVGHLSQ